MRLLYLQGFAGEECLKGVCAVTGTAFGAYSQGLRSGKSGKPVGGQEKRAEKPLVRKAEKRYCHTIGIPVRG